ncbi:MAG: DEAD/DEAH box helicase [Gammaproteobacteria bacterium]|nr:DEAD/DEAH box helicase [Gammaproteobacteria bacterium]
MSDAADSLPRFADLGLPANLLASLNTIGYETPSPIQAAAIPTLLAGEDIIGQAQTGTGKTAAFALPFLSKIDLNAHDPQVLVLTPTRELAIQVAEAFQRYASGMPGFHVLPIYGGQSMSQQLHQLRRNVHVVVGTPGRIMDHLRRETLNLANVRGLVLDEADEMLRMGFIDDVEAILQHTPSSRQTALFSATMPEPIRQVAQRHLRNPREIRIKAKTSTVEAVRQRYWQVAGLHKLDALTRILEGEELDAVIIFVRTKMATTELAERLEARGYACAALNGDLNQSQREKTIEQLKSGHLDVVIATDVAARGLDVPRISHVINYDIPYDIESYVHRIGRTGRAGRPGEAILFVSPREVRMLRAIERATRQPIEPMRAPSREAIASRRVTQFKKAVFDTLASEELEWFSDLVEEMARERGVEMAPLAAALAYMVQRDRPLQFEGAVPGADPGARDRYQRTDRPVREERAARDERPVREERPMRDERPARDERPQRAERPARSESAERAPRSEFAERLASKERPERAPRPPRVAPAPSAPLDEDYDDAALAAPTPARTLPRPGELEEYFAPPPAPPELDIPTRAERLKEFPEIDMVRYRIDVGTTHGVLPKHIVGAIANEAGLEARYIGRIDLYDDFSTIDLPDGMPKDLLEHLKTVRFGKFRYNLSPLVPQDKPKKSKKK